MTFLAVDVGNTRLKWALYPSAAVDAQPIATGAEFLENIDKLADGEWAGRSSRPLPGFRCSPGIARRA